MVTGMLTIVLSFSLLGQLDGSAVERVREVRDSLDGNSREMKRLNDRFDRWEGRILDGFDGHRLDAIGQWLAKALQTLWLTLTGIYRLASLALYTVIALCVARTAREVSEAIVAWRRPST
jgi:hypothetical protein